MAAANRHARRNTRTGHSQPKGWCENYDSCKSLTALAAVGRNVLMVDLDPGNGQSFWL